MFFYNTPEQKIEENYQAGETVGGQRIVYVLNDKYYYADKDNLNIVNYTLALSEQAVDINGFGDLLFVGEWEEVSWNWDDEKGLFLGSNGLITQTPPTSGLLIEIGTIISATKIFFEIQDIIEIL